MKAYFNFSSLVVLFTGLALALLLAQQWATQWEMVSIAAGYLLFVLNYLALIGIGRALVLISVAGNIGKRSKLWLSLGSMLKFFGLIGALFMFIVVWKLSGFYLALGSLLSLLVLTGVLVRSYLQALAKSSSV